MNHKNLMHACLASLLLVSLWPGDVTYARDAADRQADTPLPQRLLVVVPHPDDESLCGTALIRQTLEGGGRVKIAVMTNGDGFRLAAAKWFHIAHPGPSDLYRLGLVRQQEELRAAEKLGVTVSDIQFFGYPDSGLHRLWNDHWSPSTPFRASNGADHVPYQNAYHPGAPYCGEAVADDLENLLADYQPTDILYPNPQDIHNDHWATSAFVQFALGESVAKPREWTYLVHYPSYPIPRRYRPRQPLVPPHRLRTLPIPWQSRPLSAPDIYRKRAAILSHRSQTGVMRSFLQSFIRPNDLLVPYTPPLLPPPQARAAQAVQIALQDPVADQHAHEAKPGDVPTTVPSGDLSSTPSADIRRVIVSRTTSDLRVCLEMSGPIRSELTYAIHLRLPDRAAGDPLLLTCRVQDGQAVLTSDRSEDPCPAPPQVTRNQHHLTLTFPSALLGTSQSLLVRADVSDTGQVIDQSGWQRVRLATP